MPGTTAEYRSTVGSLRVARLERVAHRCGSDKSLQQIQDNCMRCICPKNPLAEIYETLCVLPVSKLIQLKQAKMDFGLCNDLLPLKWSEALLTDHRSVSITKRYRYGTRLKGIPNLPKASPTKYRKSFLCKAISVYNSLPTKLVQKKVTT